MTQDTKENFENLYQGEAVLGGFPLDIVPWDIQAPQPAVIALENAGRIAGKVLDAGCGLGENALFLAERGHQVTGFDASPSALRQARVRARSRGLDVEFVLADATSLQFLKQNFTTVIDSALYHCLPKHQRERYVAALYQVCRPGARLHLLCVSEAAPVAFPVPYRISQDDIRHTFVDGWKIVSIEPGTYTTAFTLQYLGSQVERGRFPSVDIHALALDDDGRILLPIWLVEVKRVSGFPS